MLARRKSQEYREMNRIWARRATFLVLITAALVPPTVARAQPSDLRYQWEKGKAVCLRTSDHCRYANHRDNLQGNHPLYGRCFGRQAIAADLSWRNARDKQEQGLVATKRLRTVRSLRTRSSFLSKPLLSTDLRWQDPNDESHHAIGTGWSAGDGR